MFGSRVGFSGTADRTALFTVRTNPRWRPPPCWKKFQMVISLQPVVRSISCLVKRWGFRGRQIRINSRFQPPPSWIISNGHISATAYDLLR